MPAAPSSRPGFIDNHTHVDPSLWWDSSCDPMPQHGVTTVLMGNCSLSLAPVRAADRAGVTSLFCYIEDLPESAFDSAIPWTWETWKDYHAAASGRGFSVNASGYVGHTPLRLFVMGQESWERPATEQERQRDGTGARRKPRGGGARTVHLDGLR